MGTHLRVILGLINLFLVNSQYARSPCPGVFDYHSDGFSVYGVIRLQPHRPLDSVITKVNFTVATRLPSTYLGRLEPVGSDLYLPEFKLGSPITYRVHFPVTSPLPRVTSITVNDNLVCYGNDIPEQNQYVTLISLQHTLFQRPVTHSSGEFNQGSGFNQVPEFNQISGSFNPYVEPSYTQQQFQERSPPQPNRQIVQQSQPEVRLQDYPTKQYYPEQNIQAVPLSASPTSTQRPVGNQLPGDMGCGLVPGGNESEPLIFNGQPYTRGDWPWLVAIYKRKKGNLHFICGGTLISNRHVVTAAHCIQLKSSSVALKYVLVKLGVHDLNDWADDIAVLRTPVSSSIPDSYDTTTLRNDIVVLKLDRSVEFNKYIRPACLWNGKTDQSRVIGALGILVGWGSNESGEAGQGKPRMLRLPIVGTSTCRASNVILQKLTSTTTLCAGDRMGTGPCVGDSGVGLFLLEDGRWRLRGVTSISLLPTSPDVPCNLNEYAVFTDSAQYIDWIQDAVAPAYT